MSKQPCGCTLNRALLVNKKCYSMIEGVDYTKSKSWCAINRIVTKQSQLDNGPSIQALQALHPVGHVRWIAIPSVLILLHLVHLFEVHLLDGEDMSL